MSNNYINPITYTKYTAGLNKPDMLVGKAISKGQKALVITDVNSVAAIPEIYSIIKGKDLDLVIGVSLNIKYSDNTGLVHLYAKNKRGYTHILDLLSNLTPSGDDSIDYVDLTKIEHTNDLFVIHGNNETLLGKLFNEDSIENAKALDSLVKDKFGEENIFFDVQIQSTSDLKTKIFNPDTGVASPKKVVYTNHNRFSSRQHEPIFKKKLDLSADKYNLVDDTKYSYDIDLLDESASSAQLFEQKLKSNKSILLKFEENILSNIEQFSIEREPEMIKLNIEKTLPQISNENLPLIVRPEKTLAEYKKRLDYELGVIDDMGFNDYFLFLADVCDFAKENNIPYGIRGSAAGSLVLYSLGISMVDPLEHNLLFERFLNKSRQELPDIDFEVADIEAIKTYIKDKYGKEYTASIGSYSSIASSKRAFECLNDSYQDYGTDKSKEWSQKSYDKVLAVTSFYSSSKKKTIFFKGDEKIKDLLEANEKLSNLYKTDEGCRKFINTAHNFMEGQIINKAFNNNSFVVTPRTISTYFNTIEDSKGYNYIFCPKEYLQNLGLIKIDFLSSKILKRTYDAFDHLNIENFNFRSFDNYSDPSVFTLLSSGYTESINQFKKIAQEFAISMKPDSFADLVAVMALIRPGVSQEEKDNYVKNKLNPELVTYKHEILESILSETYGIPLYEEQFMIISQKVAGFNPEQSDLLRTAIKKDKKSILISLRKPFIDGAAANNIDYQTANDIFSQLEDRAGKYSFNKSHATVYADIAYKQLWLKRYYPAEFYDNFTQGKGMKDTKAALSSELSAMNIMKLTPNINRVDFSDRTVVYSPDSLVDELFFDIGLNEIIGNPDLSNIIIKERNTNGYFDSINDFLEKIIPRAIGKDDLLDINYEDSKKEFLLVEKAFSNLALSGSFDDFASDYGYENNINVFRVNLSNNAQALFQAVLVADENLTFDIEDIDINQANKIIDNADNLLNTSKFNNKKYKV
jgi:DNA polymerase-3 subunit alpha